MVRLAPPRFAPSAIQRAPRAPAWLLNLGLLLLSLGVFSGCAKWADGAAAKGGNYHPSNVYREGYWLPFNIRRVAVLPVSVEPGDSQADASRPELESVLHSELGKTRKFELVMVSRDQVRQWTSRDSWQAEEKLPAHLLSRVQEATGCDAILFAHLRPFNAYPPLAMGWHFRLVESRSNQTVWAANEVFDAADPEVTKAAQQYGRQHAREWNTPFEPASILSSPRRFGQFSVSSLLATLPAR